MPAPLPEGVLAQGAPPLLVLLLLLSVRQSLNYRQSIRKPVFGFIFHLTDT